MSDGRNVITHSRAQCFKTCPRKHQFAYLIGMRKDRPAAPLRMGDAFHKGKEYLRKGVAPQAALEQAMAGYENVPVGFDPFEWAIEREKIFRLLHGYLHIYRLDNLKIVATELPYLDLPIVNPETGHASTRFVSGGKIDGIVQLPDGRLAVDETKTTSSSLDDDSDYWSKLSIDEQISRYMYAARQTIDPSTGKGYDIQTVHYDVIRKPTISPKQIALTDEQGLKIVLDANGQRVRNKGTKKDPEGGWKQSGDTAQGWTLQTRLETAQEYGDRLTDDIFERPTFYFARKEIQRTEADINEYLIEYWQLQKAMAESENNGRHFRNTGACLSPFRCEYADVCFSGWKPDMQIPQGFRLLDHVHPELESEGE